MRMLLLALIVFISPTLARAAEPPERLVERLGSPRFAEREQATAALRQHGPQVIPLLRKALASKDIETRRRVQLLLDELVPQAEGRELLTAQKVKLDYQDTPLAVALVDFTRRTGMAVVLSEAEQEQLAQRRVSVKTDEVPVWEALEQFCAAVRLCEKPLNVPVEPAPTPVVPSDGRARRRRVIWVNSVESQKSALQQGRIVLLDGKPARTSTTYVGGLRIQAVTPEGAKPSSGPEQTALTLTFATDGRARWQQVEYVRIDRAIDVLGQTLRADRVFVPESPTLLSNDEEVLLLWDESGDWPLRPHEVRHAIVRLNLPSRRSATLKELTGVVGAQIETPPERLIEVEVASKALNKEHVSKDGGTRVKITEIDSNTDQLFRLRVELTRLAAPPPMPLVGGNVRIVRGMRRGIARDIEAIITAQELKDRGLVLLDRDGKDVPLSMASTEGKGQYLLAFQPAKGQTGPFKLAVSGRRTVYVEVPFTLANVPLR